MEAPHVNQHSAINISKGVLLTFLLVTMVGLTTSIQLSVLHWKVHNQPEHVSSCAISQEVNCDTVALSEFSTFAGLPIGTWGGLYYLATIVLGLWGFLKLRGRSPWSILGLATSFAVGLSSFLYMASLFSIQSVCRMCQILYLVNLVNSGLFVFGLRREGVPLVSGIMLGLLGICAGLLAYLVGYSSEVASNWPIVLVSIIGVAIVALSVLGGIRGLPVLVDNLKYELVQFFKNKLFGFGMAGLAVVIAVLAMIVVPGFYPSNEQLIASGAKEMKTGHTNEGHPWIGAENAKLVITEFSDYECPYCRKAHETLREIVRDNKDWLRLVHVHVPLDNKCNKSISRPFHKHACDCARAGICADKMGKFWEMNDILFARCKGLDAGGLAMMASKLGLNTAKFRACMQAQETEQKLQLDLTECRGVAEECREMGKRFGTPTFTMAGQVIVGFKPKEWWAKAVAEARP
jgi:protein-disulfide isomerase/uncharacterized membrane protein